MSRTADALAYLVVRTTVNRLARQLGRLKSPRYAIAAAAGLLYFWGVFARPGSASIAPSSAPVETIAAVGLAITVLGWWLSGAVTGALAFQPAEVQILFPAPIPRRALIVYKVIRSQLLLLLSCVFWTLLTRSWGVTLGWPLRFATLWAFFSVLSLHRLGAALVMTPPVTGGRRVARLAGRALAAAGAVALLAGAGPVLLDFGRLGFVGGLRALGEALAAPPAGYALAPFRLLVAPLHAGSDGVWLRAFAAVVGIVGLHLLWVLAMNVRFEEVAAQASADLARRVAAFKERRAGGVVVRPGKAMRSWFPLAPTGRPAVAIIWKNTVALMRTGLLRTAIVVIVVTLGMSYAMTAGGEAVTGPGAAIPFVALAGMAMLLGPRAVRNDLRQDLLNLATIKTYPLSGVAVVFAELVSPTLVLSLFQLLMLALAYANLPASYREAWPASTTVALALLVPPALLVVNAAGVAVQNGFALLYPGWVRLGADSGGIEAIGQTMVVTIGSFLVVMIGLLLPALSGAIVYALLRGWLGGAALGVAGLLGLVVLGVEVALMVAALGAMFERTDPTALG